MLDCTTTGGLELFKNTHLGEHGTHVESRVRCNCTRVEVAKNAFKRRRRREVCEERWVLPVRKAWDDMLFVVVGYQLEHFALLWGGVW
jgi:hypothetical protein